MSLIASLAKQEEEEEKHRKKNAAREAQMKERIAQASRAPMPQKHIKKITSTKEKRLQFNKLQRPEEVEEEAMVHVKVVDDTGTPVPFALAAENILAFLQDHGSEATLDEVHRAVGINLKTQHGLLEQLRLNPRIEATALVNGEVLRYLPPFDVRDRTSLAHLLSRASPGVGSVEAVLRSELKADETYAGIDADIDELLAQGCCARIEVSDKRNRDFVLVAMPRGRGVSEEVRKLWREEEVPDKDKLEQDLLKYKLRSKDDFDKRKRRREEVDRRLKEERDQPKQARQGKVLKYHNKAFQAILEGGQ